MKAIDKYQRSLEDSQSYHLKEMLISMVKNLPYGKQITISRIGEGASIDPASTDEVEVSLDWVEVGGEIRNDTSVLAQIVYQPSQ